MRIAIASDGDRVAEHFGRCPSYTLVDIEDGTVVHRETVDNPGHEPGRIPVFLKEQGAEIIVAGGMGGRAQMLFDQMDIQQILGITGPVEQVVASCLDGSLEGAESLCSHGEGRGDGHGPGAGGGDHECGSRHRIICITAKGEGEDAAIDPRFGRCSYFCFYDTETKEYRFEKNEFVHESGGVGVLTSQHLVNRGVEALLTGQVGPNAFRALEAAGILMYTGFEGNVAEGVKRYLEGGLQTAGGPSNKGHVG